MTYALIILLAVLWNRLGTRRADAMMEGNISYLIDTHGADLQRMKAQRDMARESGRELLTVQAQKARRRRESALKGWETRRNHELSH